MPKNKLDTLWYTRCGVPTALGIAAHLGWLDKEFAQEGIAIRSIRDSEDQRVRESHFDHNQMHSVRQGGSSPPIWARAQGRDTRVIGLIWTDEAQQILTLPSTKIRSVKDLKGRRVALPKRDDDRFPRLDVRGASALRGFLAALSTEGLTEKDVEFLQLRRDDPQSFRAEDRVASFGYSFGDEALALLNGQVDAIFVKDARGKAVEAFLNAIQVIDVGSHPDPAVRVNYGVPRPLTVDSVLLHNHPDIAERLLGVVIEAGAWASRNPKETRAIVAQEVRTPEHFVDLAYPDLHRNLHTDLREDWIDHFEAYKDFLFKWGFLAQNFDVRAWIDPGPLSAWKARQVSRSKLDRAVAQAE